MSQIQTNIELKDNTAPNNELSATEFNTLTSTIDNNALDAESRLVSLENDNVVNTGRIDILEDTMINNIETYEVGTIPLDKEDGTVSFLSDLGYLVYIRDGVWYKLSDHSEVTPTVVDLFIIAGGGNADGSADVNNLSASLQSVDRTSVLMYQSTVDENNNNALIAGNWSGMVAGTNTSENSNKFGPEVGFVDNIEGYENPIAIMKFAKGNTNLGEDWNLNFNDNYMLTAFKQALTDAFNKLTNDGYTYRIRGMVWFQGEDDSSDVNFANNYQSNFNDFFSDIKSYLNISELPLIICKVDYTSGNETTYLDEIREYHQKISDSASNIGLVDSGNFSRINTVDLDATGMYTLGSECAGMLYYAKENQVVPSIGVNPAGSVNVILSLWNTELPDWDLGDGSRSLDTLSVSHTYTDGKPIHYINVYNTERYNINSIEAQNHGITYLNLDQLPRLVTLKINTNSVTELDFSSNILFTTLRAASNNLTNFVSTPSMESIIISTNNLSSVDLSNSPKVHFLRLENNNLNDVDISGLPLLETLLIYNNNLDDFDISNNPLLIDFNISGNNISSNTVIDNMLIALDNYGLSNGDFNYSNNTAENSLTALSAYNNLVSKGWTITGNAPV